MLKICRAILTKDIHSSEVPKEMIEKNISFGINKMSILDIIPALQPCLVNDGSYRIR